ncbi:MAG: LacI family DNA-binding transcriptional regulator [Paracoccaceae bacterium]
MAITLKDVAELAGVSRSAVSRTYTEGASVSGKTREKVLRAATALGYSPNALASSLTTGRTKMIGLVSNNFHNPVFLEVFDQFTRGLHERGLRPLLVNLTDETDPEASVKMLRQYSVDGVIVASSTLPPAFAKRFRDVGIPVVHSFGRHISDPDVDVVGIDNIAAGALVARTLIQRGYTDLGFLGGPSDATSTQDREKGFLKEIARHKGVAATNSFASAYSFEAGRAEMTRLLESDPAQAYFCADDVLCIGALSALQSGGFQVPEDVGLIGLNDMKMASWANLNLTTVHNPFSDIIETSITRVAALIEDQSVTPESRLFDCHVVERGTLRPL